MSLLVAIPSLYAPEVDTVILQGFEELPPDGAARVFRRTYVEVDAFGIVTPPGDPRGAYARNLMIE